MKEKLLQYYKDNAESINKYDIEHAEREFERMEERGYSMTDARRTINCWEEVNPIISEEKACRIMKEISDKYPRVF